MKFLGLLPQKFLGVDIGTSSIKVVEVSSWAGRKKLENYGEISASVLYKKQFRTSEENTLMLSSREVSRAIKAILQEAEIKTKEVAFSIPDFSSFFTTFELPPMTEEEVPQAVKSEARRHVPLPLGEVTLDWQIIDEPQKESKGKLKVLMVAVPNEIIHQYQSIATGLSLKLMALEAEIFGLMRAVVDRDEKEAVTLVDIGARSTSCSIINRGTLKISRSFDVSGNSFTERISKGLSLGYKQAEEFKNSYGILRTQEDSGRENVRDILIPLVDLIVREVDRVIQGFTFKENKEVKKVILCGGNAFMPGLLEHFQEYFPKKEVEITNPFAKIFFPPILEEELKKMGPAYAIALGTALRGLE